MSIGGPAWKARGSPRASTERNYCWGNRMRCGEPGTDFRRVRDSWFCWVGQAYKGPLDHTKRKRADSWLPINARAIVHPRIVVPVGRDLSLRDNHRKFIGSSFFRSSVAMIVKQKSARGGTAVPIGRKHDVSYHDLPVSASLPLGNSATLPETSPMHLHTVTDALFGLGSLVPYCALCHKWRCVLRLRDALTHGTRVDRDLLNPAVLRRSSDNFLVYAF